MKFRSTLFSSLLLASAATAVAESDLVIYHAANTMAPLVGTNVTFTLDIYNDGPDDATGVTVTDQLPSGYQFVSAVAESGSYDAGTGLWSIGPITAFNASPAKLTITAKVLSTGNYTCTATVSGNETDPDPSDNTSNATTTPTFNIYWDGGTANIDPMTLPPDGSSAGGAGTWNTTLKNWDSGSSAMDYSTWDNSLGYVANLGGPVGTAGTVTLGSAISASKLVITAIYPATPVYPTPIYTIDTGSNALTLSGTGTTISGNNFINISGTGPITLGSSQTWANTTNTLTVSAPVSTGANLLTLNTGNNNLDVTGKISGSGGLTVNSTQTGGNNASDGGIVSGAPATPTLGSSNDYTGTTTLTGWIWLNSGGVSAFGSDTSDIIFNNGGVRLKDTGTIDRGIQLSGGTSGIAKISGITTVNGVISGSGNFTFMGNYAGGAIGGAGAVVLNAANTFTGEVKRGNDGTLRLAHVNALQFATLDTTITTATGVRSLIDLNNLACNIGGLRGNGSLALGTALGAGGDGYVTIGGNNLSNVQTGVLSGDAGIRKSGSGIQTFGGVQTYLGKTQVSQGSLRVGVQSDVLACKTGTSLSQKRLINLPSTAGLAVGQSVSGTGIGLGSVIASIDSATQVTLSVNLVTANANTTATFGSMAGTIDSSPEISVASGATLDVSAQPYTLVGTQTLKGAGTVVGAITCAGTIAPGSSVGTLTTGNVTFAATGQYACELNGATSDLLAAGTLTVDPAAKITFSGTPTAASYVIATYTGAEPTHFATDPTLPAGYGLDYSTPGQIKLVGGVVSPPYDSWATSKGLSGGNAAASADPDNDGLDNGIEFVIGGEPNPANPNANSNALTPTVQTTATHLVFTFRRTDVAMTQPGIALSVEYGSTLAGWTAAQNGVNGVSIVTTDDGFGAGVDKVEVSIPKTLAVGARIFARLKSSL